VSAPIPHETAAWLAGLTPAKLQAAAAATRLHQVDAVVTGLALLVVADLIYRGRLLTRVREHVEAQGRRPWIATAVCALVVSATLVVVWETCTAFGAWDENGASIANLPATILKFWSRAPITILMFTLAASVLYYLIRRLPRAWWAISAGALSLFFFAVVWAPDALVSGPSGMAEAPAGAVRDGVLDLIHSTDLPAEGVQVSPRPGLDADVTGGIGGLAHVDVTRAMLAEPVSEARAAVGHVMGHQAHRDMLSYALLLSALTFLGFFIADRFFATFQRLLSYKRPLWPSDPEAMPVMAMFLVVWLAVSSITTNNFVRLINVGADQYSLDHAKEPDGLALWLIRDWRGDKPNPSPLEETLFYDHPSLVSRLQHIAQWKAAHAKTAPVARDTAEAVEASRTGISDRPGG
jgi:STE24 endopeptidase